MSSLNEFPIGWQSFAPKLRLPVGQKTFVVVDDHTGPAIWDDVLFHAELDQSVRAPYRLLNIMRGMGMSESLHNQAGIPCIANSSLPAIFVIEHGSDVGRYILKVSVDQAVRFINSEISTTKTIAEY